MTDEAKQVFTRRLTQCNRGELVVIMYDILFTHLMTAKEALEKCDGNEFSESLRMAQMVLERLMSDLNFKYDISRQLYPLYVFCRNELAKAMYENRPDRIETAEKILKSLYSAFTKAAESDTSGPLMRNTQQVYAGMTYGKCSVNENLMDTNTQRGFFV